MADCTYMVIQIPTFLKKINKTSSFVVDLFQPLVGVLLQICCIHIFRTPFPRNTSGWLLLNRQGYRKKANFILYMINYSVTTKFSRHSKEVFFCYMPKVQQRCTTIFVSQVLHGMKLKLVPQISINNSLICATSAS